MLSETMLGITQFIVTVEVPDDMDMDYVLGQLTTNTSEGYWPIVCWRGFVSFIEDG